VNDQTTDDAFLQALTDLGAEPEIAEIALADLQTRHAEPQRRYHTFEHVHAMWGVIVDTLAPEAPSSAVCVAVWYHDSIYDPKAKNNEEASAKLADETLETCGAPSDVRERVTALIMSTKTHQPADDAFESRLLIDADLATLGASPDVYDTYAQAIRAEYAWVEDAAYRTGRAAVLRSFLDRERIYITPQIYASHETRARENLTRELRDLGV
jgi:predicted metal-dependent HD superfamily phosphohydrolase